MPRSLDGKRDMIACRICVYFLRRATISSPGEVETTGWSTAGILFYYWYKIGHDRRMRGLFIRFKHVPRQYISLCVFSFRIGEWMSPRANRAARTCFRIKKVSWWWSKSVFFSPLGVGFTVDSPSLPGRRVRFERCFTCEDDRVTRWFYILYHIILHPKKKSGGDSRICQNCLGRV